MKVVILGYRVAGLDGVSLETVHWKNILERMGHKVTLIAGELDREGILIPELHFKWPHVAQIHERVVYGGEPYKKVERGIFTLAGKLEGKLRELFRNGRDFDLLIVPNVFSIPMHFPLTIALDRTIGDFAIKTLARHHDFWWERERYKKSHMFPFFRHWFPPRDKKISHTVINTIARRELEERTKIKASVIPDTFDFSSDKNKIDSYNKYWRRDFGIDADDLVFLQATRIVPRKRIELSIELISKLGNPKAVLVISGAEGDEGKGYLKKLQSLAQDLKVRTVFIGDRVNSHRKVISGKRIYTLWDCYVNSDFVTYPTEVEGFGNQFVEAMYFRKPIIITPYPVFKTDIQSLGFDVISMPHRVTKKVVDEVKALISKPIKIENMVNGNFQLAKENFDYSVVAGKLKKIFNEMGLA